MWSTFLLLIQIQIYLFERCFHGVDFLDRAGLEGVDQPAEQPNIGVTVINNQSNLLKSNSREEYATQIRKESKQLIIHVGQLFLPGYGRRRRPDVATSVDSRKYTLYAVRFKPHRFTSRERERDSPGQSANCGDGRDPWACTY